ncbi:histidine kinase [Streptomyces sp. NPDC005955]|uniref:sensor histidine kinase n=1 Tax=Streptomyces sp. NPDC005955 TaxID=3364738 RepID=UPI0036C0F5D7
MIRPILAAVAAPAVVATDTLLLTAAHLGGPSRWVTVPGYAALAVALVWWGRRAPAAAFAATVVVSVVPGAYTLLLWSGYRAGHAPATRAGTAITVGAACGGLAAQLALRAAGVGIATVVTGYLVFVAMPLLVGRHQAQHDQLVAALSQRNRQLVRRQELLAERERLAERLRIARDMHDSLGGRLSLVSVQAAALEVADLPPAQRDGVRRLAGSARGAVDDLHELVGALRGAEEASPEPGPAAVERVVAEFREAGVPVVLSGGGEPLELTDAGWRAAYRVVQEGLTNAVKHAAGQPVTVAFDWEGDAALLTVVSRGATGPDRGTAPGAGHGLAGLRERVRHAGGLLDHGPTGDGFRLLAMLPARRPDAEDGRGVRSVAAGDVDLDGPVPPWSAVPDGTVRSVVQGVAVAVLVFVVVPGSLMLGVR